MKLFASLACVSIFCHSVTAWVYHSIPATLCHHANVIMYSIVLPKKGLSQSTDYAGTVGRIQAETCTVLR